MIIKKKIAGYLAKRDFIRCAIEEKADLGEFMKKPPKHIIIKNSIGLFLILFSYIIGWPLIALLGVVSVSTGEPLIIVIGGPAAYGISHIVFIAGMYLTGAHYTMIFLRWLARITVEKLIGANVIAEAINQNNNYRGIIPE